MRVSRVLCGVCAAFAFTFATVSCAGDDPSAEKDKKEVRVATTMDVRNFSEEELAKRNRAAMTDKNRAILDELLAKAKAKKAKEKEKE